MSFKARVYGALQSGARGAAACALIGGWLAAHNPNVQAAIASVIFITVAFSALFWGAIGFTLAFLFRMAMPRKPGRHAPDFTTQGNNAP